MKSVVCAALLLFSQGFAESTTWEGEVNSNGTPTELIKLTLGKTYNIKVSGTVNTEKWHQGGAALGEDACFDFGDRVQPIPNELIKNSMGLDFCGDRLYHSDHIYESHAFVAKQNGIHFWVNDTDYSDNNGSFKIQVVEL